MKEYTRNEIKKRIIMEQLEDKDAYQLVDIYNDVVSCEDYLWNDLEMMLKDNNEDAYDVVFKVYNASDFNPNDDYFRYNVYDHLESFSEWDAQQMMCDELKDYHIDELIDNYEDEFDLSDLEELESVCDELDEKEQLYNELKETHKKELDEFISKYVVFAFDLKQLEDNAKEKGLQLNKLTSIGFGGFILEDKAKDYYEIITRHNDELKERLRTDDDFLRGALWFELPNHEYGYTREFEDTFDALGIDAELYESKKAIIGEISDVLIKIDYYIN